MSQKRKRVLSSADAIRDILNFVQESDDEDGEPDLSEIYGEEPGL